MCAEGAPPKDTHRNFSFGYVYSLLSLQDMAHSLDLLICMDLEEVLLNTEQVSWLAEAL